MDSVTQLRGLCVSEWFRRGANLTFGTGHEWARPGLAGPSVGCQASEICRWTVVVDADDARDQSASCFLILYLFLLHEASTAASLKSLEKLLRSFVEPCLCQSLPHSLSLSSS